MDELKASDADTEAARIIVVDDHAVVRDGLVALINREQDLTVCAEAEGITDAMKVIQEHQPDLVVLDMILRDGNGLDLIKQGRILYPHIDYLVISMQDEEIYAERCIKAGARGYIMKYSATDEFLDAMRAVLSGEVYVSKKMNVRLLRRMADRHDTLERTGVESLSDRELQIFQMIGAGMTAREIAPQLGISPKTVATHRENLKTKLGMKDGRALLQYAMQWVEGGATPSRQ